MSELWTLTPSDGELSIRTGVTGRAARMGHRLTIAMTRWEVTVAWAGAEPLSAELAVEVGSLEVVRGEGGVRPVRPGKGRGEIERVEVVGRWQVSEIRYAAETIEKAADGYRLTGKLHIRGKSRTHVVDVRTEDLGDAWRMTVESTVRQTDYGVKPYSLLMGSLQVADDVSVSFIATHAKDA